MKVKLFFTTILIAACALLTPVTSPAFATSTGASATDVCSMENISPEVREAYQCDGATDYDIIDSVQAIINGVIVVLGIVAVIVIVYSGVQFMTSTGDAAKVQKAKATLTAAVIGLAICILSAAIVNLVIGLVVSGNTSATDTQTTSTNSTLDTGSSTSPSSSRTPSR